MTDLNWTSKKIKWLFNIIGSGTTPNSQDQSFYEGEIPWVITGDLKDSLITNVSKTITRKALKEYSTLKIYPEGSLIIAMYGATIGKLGILAFPSTTNQACSVLSYPKENIDLRFIYYWFLGNRKQIIALSSGGGQPNISQEIIRNLRIMIPEKYYQEKVVVFLDKETFKIDNLIEKKQRLIELLQEKRQALITNAVTKGLDPNVPMKDSGISWLGEVPEHWEMKKLKYITRMVGGSTPTKDNLEFWNGDIPWVSPKDMKVDCIHSSQDYITQKGLIHSSLELVPKNSTLIVVRSGILKHTLPVAITKVETTLNQDMKALIPRSNFLLNEYLFWMFKGLAKSVLDNSWKIGATVDSIETELLDNLLFPIPGQEEQKTIIEYLENRTTNISRLIAKIQTQITKLQEYRQALITSAVTGKIDVREKVSS